MDKKFVLTIPSSDVVAYSSSIGSLKCLAASADRDFDGKMSYSIADVKTGEVLVYQKHGLDATLADVANDEYPSVRLYNCILRRVVEMTRLPVDNALKISMREIRDMTANGRFINMRNCGSETRAEFYAMLAEYCGDTRATQAAINADIELTRHEWLRRHPEDILSYRDPLAVWWINLDTEYYGQ